MGVNILYTSIIAPIELLIEVFFVLFHKIFHNWGFAIISISMLVSILTLPLYHVAEKLQQRERNQRLALQPGIDRIKAAFKGDEQYMMLSTFYRQNSYHPLYGLRSTASLLIQIPFFIAAYHFLTHLNQLQGARFFFIPDLGSSDGLLRVGGVSINLLPIAMTLINVLSSIVYTRGFPLRDKIQLYGIATIFLVLLYQSPAGLVLYWTLNNVFSLVKALFYKLKHPRRVLIALVVVGSGALVFLILMLKPDLDRTKRMLLIGTGVFGALSPFLLLLLGWLARTLFKPFAEDSRRVFGVYLLSALVLFVLLGVVVPANLIASSPIEFSFTGSVQNPLSYIGYVASFFAGLLVMWPLLIYGISTTEARSLLSLGLLFLALSALFNVFLFSGSYGFISTLFLFDDPSVLAVTRMQTLLPPLLSLGTLLVVVVVLQTRAGRWIPSLLMILLISSSASSIYAMVQINKEFQEHALNLAENPQRIQTDGEIEPIITLSRTEKNVVILFLDRAISSFFPLVIEQSPHLKDQYAGFVYYPNTLSYGRKTVTGSPAMMGGYEYTPDEIDLRRDETLVDKHNEASLVLSLMFSQLGLQSTILDPPLPNHKWSYDFSAFAPYPEIEVLGVTGEYSDYYREHSAGDGGLDSNEISTLIRERFPMFVLFQSFYPILRPLIYDDGTYFLKRESPGNLDEFIDSFAVLHYLPTLTDVKEGRGAFVFLGNDTTHTPIFLQAPQYEPRLEVTDFTNPLQTDAVYGKMEERHYHANAAALLQIGFWLEYLKDEGVYDTTRIIIVADHGYDIVTPPFKEFANQGKAMAKFNPLLLMKDFYAGGDVSEDRQFMTNADAPLFALEGFFDDPINPLTNQRMREFIQKDAVNVYKVPSQFGKEGNTVFNVDLSQSYTVRNDIFEESNWSLIQIGR